PYAQMLRHIRLQSGLRRLELRGRDLTVEIGVEPQQQIDVVDRQADDRSNTAVLHADLRVADAEGVGGERRAQQHRDGEDGPHLSVLGFSSYSPRGTIAR